MGRWARATVTERTERRSAPSRRRPPASGRAVSRTLGEGDVGQSRYIYFSITGPTRWTRPLGHHGLRTSYIERFRSQNEKVRYEKKNPCFANDRASAMI